MMCGYVVSRSGTFGVVDRCYVTESGEPGVVISWGPLGWLTPVLEKDCKQLRSRWQDEARKEAEEWIASLENSDE